MPADVLASTVEAWTRETFSPDANMGIMAHDAEHLALHKVGDTSSAEIKDMLGITNGDMTVEEMFVAALVRAVDADPTSSNRMNYDEDREGIKERFAEELDAMVAGADEPLEAYGVTNPDGFDELKEQILDQLDFVDLDTDYFMVDEGDTLRESALFEAFKKRSKK